MTVSARGWIAVGLAIAGAYGAGRRVAASTVIEREAERVAAGRFWTDVEAAIGELQAIAVERYEAASSRAPAEDLDVSPIDPAVQCERLRDLVRVSMVSADPLAVGARHGVSRG